MPNKPVKGMRRPLSALKFGFYPGSAVSLKLSGLCALTITLSGFTGLN